MDESASCPVTDYLRLEKAQSPVWMYFGFPAEDGNF